MRAISYTCKQCTTQFERPAKRQGYRYCSRKCANAKHTKVTAESLRPYAEKGSRTKVIAGDFGVIHSTVCRALRRYGLHRTWSLRRFKKCAEAA